MKVNSRKPAVRLSSAEVIDRFDWKLFQDGELLEERSGITSGITDGTCIRFTPSKSLRRGPAKDIKVPEGFFYPPFGPRLVFKSKTYHGHSDFSVDFNHGAAGANAGLPVLAAAPGKVLIRDFRAPGTTGPLDPGNSDVLIGHPGGFRTLYTHMMDIPDNIRPGKRVVLGQRLGRISDIGNAEGTHLHHCHFRDGSGFGRPIKMRIMGTPLKASLGDSKTGHQPGFVLEPDDRFRGPVFRAILKVRVRRRSDGMRSPWRPLRFLVARADAPVPDCLDPGCPGAATAEPSSRARTPKRARAPSGST
jgi:murein DD-endopeptidase MepM/ murein hydrolase activator NlpD